ncbi:MAG: hypothetical protein L0Z53_15115 [Acidobacteriales bacterium]|nr:hypothetical protein [Terriglobales bacterium]
MDEINEVLEELSLPEVNMLIRVTTVILLRCGLATLDDLRILDQIEDEMGLEPLVAAA